MDPGATAVTPTATPARFCPHCGSARTPDAGVCGCRLSTPAGRSVLPEIAGLKAALGMYGALLAVCLGAATLPGVSNHPSPAQEIRQLRTFGDLVAIVAVLGCCVQWRRIWPAVRTLGSA